MSNYSPYLDASSLTSSPVSTQRSYLSPSNWAGNEDTSPASGKSQVAQVQTFPKRDGIVIDTTLTKTEMTGLDMSGFRIKRLPLELFNFGFLTELRLAGNFLTAIPPEICLLRTLTSLDLSNNQLSAVPRELSKLTNLTELLLYNNQLTVLPAELGYLYQLQSFGIEGNPIIEPILSVLHSQGSLMVIPFLRDHMISKLILKKIAFYRFRYFATNGTLLALVGSIQCGQFTG